MFCFGDYFVSFPAPPQSDRVVNEAETTEYNAVYLDYAGEVILVQRFRGNF